MNGKPYDHNNQWEEYGMYHDFSLAAVPVSKLPYSIADPIRRTTWSANNIRYGWEAITMDGGKL
jgi:hypothetical protein